MNIKKIKENLDSLNEVYKRNFILVNEDVENVVLLKDEATKTYIKFKSNGESFIKLDGHSNYGNSIQFMDCFGDITFNTMYMFFNSVHHKSFHSHSVIYIAKEIANKNNINIRVLDHVLNKEYSVAMYYLKDDQEVLICELIGENTVSIISGACKTTKMYNSVVSRVDIRNRLEYVMKLDEDGNLRNIDDYFDSGISLEEFK